MATTLELLEQTMRALNAEVCQRPLGTRIEVFVYRKGQLYQWAVGESLESALVEALSRIGAL